MKEKLKNLNAKAFPNVQVLTLEEVKYITGGFNMQSSTGGIFGTTQKPVTTAPARLF